MEAWMQNVHWLAMEWEASVIVALAVVIGLCAFPFLNWLQLLPYWLRKSQLPQGSLGWPVIGESIEYLRQFAGPHPEKFITTRVAKYGSIYLSHILGSPIIAVTDLADLKALLSHDNVKFIPSQPKSLQILSGEQSLLNISGDKHKNLRKHVMPFLFPEAVRHQIGDIERMALLSLEQWKEKKTWDANEPTRAYAYNVIGRILLSLDPGETTAAYMREFDILRKGFKAFPYNIPGTDFSKALESKKKLYRMIGDIIAARKTSRHGHKDLLEGLLTAKDEVGAPKFTQATIADTVNLMLIAGVGTTASHLGFLCKYLIEYPDAMQRLKEEHDAIRSRIGPGTPLTWDDYRSMIYTHQVTSEALRIVSSISEISRQPVTDMEYKEMLLPKGHRVLFYLKTLHSDPEKFPEPDKFDPSRWENPKDLPLLPFGWGQRLCPGADLGKLEIAVFLHHLVTKFRMKANLNVPTTSFPVPSFPKGFPVTLEPL